MSKYDSNPISLRQLCKNRIIYYNYLVAIVLIKNEEVIAQINKD